MFVKCSKRVRFTHPENSKVTWEMPAGYIGDVPNWVEKEWYFAACCKDGIITTIKSKSDRDIQNATDNTQQGEEGEPTVPNDNGQGAEEENEPPKQSGTKKDNGGKK